MSKRIVGTASLVCLLPIPYSLPPTLHYRTNNVIKNSHRDHHIYSQSAVLVLHPFSLSLSTFLSHDKQPTLQVLWFTHSLPHLSTSSLASFILFLHFTTIYIHSIDTPFVYTYISTHKRGLLDISNGISPNSRNTIHLMNRVLLPCLPIHSIQKYVSPIQR